MVKSTVIEALADAADADGALLDIDLPGFFKTHIAKVLNRGLADDEEVSPLVYDQFTAITLIECINTLMLDHGLLARRGNGDSVDYRLILPKG